MQHHGCRGSVQATPTRGHNQDTPAQTEQTRGVEEHLDDMQGRRT